MEILKPEKGVSMNGIWYSKHPGEHTFSFCGKFKEDQEFKLVINHAHDSSVDESEFDHGDWWMNFVVKNKHPVLGTTDEYNVIEEYIEAPESHPNGYTIIEAKREGLRKFREILSQSLAALCRIDACCLFQATKYYGNYYLQLGGGLTLILESENIEYFMTRNKNITPSNGDAFGWVAMLLGNDIPVYETPILSSINCDPDDDDAFHNIKIEAISSACKDFFIPILVQTVTAEVEFLNINNNDGGDVN